MKANSGTGLVVFSVLSFLSSISFSQEKKFVLPCPDGGRYRGWLYKLKEKNGEYKLHLGHDFDAPAGTEVRAIADGEVSQIRLDVPGFGSRGTRGPLIWIKHRLSNGKYFQALYGHVQPVKGLKEGDLVKANQVIGTIIKYIDRKTGKDISHLHFGIWENEEVPPKGTPLGYGDIGFFRDPKEFLRINRPYSQLEEISKEKNASIFDQNQILNDSDFSFADSWNKEQIQAFFEKRGSFFKDYIDPVTGKLASWVIADRAQYYQISSKVLLAKMQAESSSIWDSSISRRMMERDCRFNGKYVGKGVDWVLNFGWTDKGPILKYKGFYNQVDGAAKLLSLAFTRPEAFTDAKGKKWSIGELHSVYDGIVVPKNRATIALYVYTPWIKSNRLFYRVWQMMFRSFNLVPERALPQEGVITSLVIDCSGSMKGEKIEKAKKAAHIYISGCSSEDMVSLITFSSNAKELIAPTLIGQGRELLNKSIFSVSAGGNTNIGSGLRIALSHLSLSNLRYKRAVLMSDGKNNTGTFTSEVKEFQERGWPIYTVAFGKDADQKTLRWIAEQTGGSFFPAGIFNLGFVYRKINIVAHNGSVYRSYNDFIFPGQTLSYNIPVELDMRKVGFFVHWQGSRMEMVLLAPDNTRITRRNIADFGKYVEGETYACFEIENPQRGNWQVVISGYELPPKGEQVNFLSFCESDVFSNILGFQPQYSINQPVRIGVRLAELAEGRLLPLRGWRVVAEIKKPSISLNKFISGIKGKSLDPRIFIDLARELSGSTEKIILFDDGIHQDEQARDGIYANAYKNTSINGPYLVTVICQGTTSDGKILKRLLQESFQVGPIERNPFTVSDFLALINAQGKAPQEKQAGEQLIDKLIEGILEKR